MKNKEEILEEILKLTKEYYKCAHDVEDNFIPGKSKVNYAGRVYDENELVNLVNSSLEFWLTYGRYSEKFEKELADFLNIKYLLLVNSGSSANLLAFMALTSPLLNDRQVKRGDEIITVAAGFPTTITPILQYGSIPVFVDIELPTYNIDTNQLENAMSERTKGVMLAHTLGNPFNINKIKEFCKKYNLWLIEDNCDALGSRYNNSFTGTLGDIGTSSFYPPHHMTMGEGGAVYTNNALLKKIMLSMRDWGRDCWCNSGTDNTCNNRFTGKFGELPVGYDHKYVYNHFGYNLKATDLQAAVGCAQLEKLNSFITARKKNFQFLYENLKNLEDVFILPEATENSSPSWFGFILTLKDNLNFKRNDLSAYLEHNNIQTRNLFAGNITKHPCFTSLTEGTDYRVAGSLDNTDKIMNNSFWFGLYPGMTETKLKFITDTILKYVEEKK